METITTAELNNLLQHDDGTFVLVDVREDDEFKTMHIKGAQHIPLGHIEKHADELKKYKTVYLQCGSGNRSGKACEKLKTLGIHGVNVQGGILDWIQHGYQIQTGEQQ